MKYYFYLTIRLILLRNNALNKSEMRGNNLHYVVHF